MLRRLAFLFLFQFAMLASPALADAKAEPPRRVLVLYENDATLFAAVQVAEGLKKSMASHMPTGLEVYSDYIDSVRFPGPDHLDSVETYLAAKYREMAFDAVLAVGPGAFKFVLDRPALFGAHTPVIAGAISDNSVAAFRWPATVKGVVSHFDVGKTIDLARQLQPDAEKIVVMTGSSVFDRSWQDSARSVLGSRYKGIDVEYLSGLSVEGFADAASKLSRRTILLILTIFEDGNGRKMIPRSATAMIAPVSNAPVYSVYSSYLGAGVVGGHVGTFTGIGEQMGELMFRVMKGDTSGPQVTLLRDGPMVDWLQVKRYGIDPGLIPAGAVIENFEATIWERFRTQIGFIIAVVLLQFATIAALVFQHRRQKRLQSELALERLELSYLSRTSQLGELSGAFAHELNQPLTSILANAEAGAKLLEAEPIDRQELKEILADIVQDDKRAASIIAQLRHLMLRGEASHELVDLNRVVTQTLALARSELLARQTQVEFHPGAPELPVLGNLVQLQQVVLNLILNAADAMANMPYQERKIAIQTRRGHNDTCEVVVSDRGPGIPPELADKIFKPFVSTKKKSLGLGLVICNSIVGAHGGTLRFDDKVERGARAVLALPSP
jgi:signal transduction histidine kinase